MTVFHPGTLRDFKAFLSRNKGKIHKMVATGDRIIVYHDPLETDGTTVFVQGVFPCST